MNNIGLYGPESLRLKGKTVDQLPIREARLTLDQLPLVNTVHRQNQIEDVKAKYPHQTIAWCDGAIRECKGNMYNVRSLRSDTERQINEYMAIISLCKLRDKKLATAKTDEQRKELSEDFPPYDVKAMKQQVSQFRQTINRCDEVIDKEQESISELVKLRAKCEERDLKLKSLGYTDGG